MSKIIAFGKSDVGLRRSNNEDVFLLKPDLDMFAVADGVGGAASGEIASRIFSDTAFEVFSSSFSKTNNCSEEDTTASVQRTFQLANEKILTSALQNPRHKGMGCTAELIAF